MDVEFIEPALIELDDAIEYYNLQSYGLGDKFFNEVLKTIELISLFLEGWTQNTEHTRKAVMKKFAYNMIYTIHHNKIYIIISIENQSTGLIEFLNNCYYNNFHLPKNR